MEIVPRNPPLQDAVELLRIHEQRLHILIAFARMVRQGMILQGIQNRSSTFRYCPESRSQMPRARSLRPELFQP